MDRIDIEVVVSVFTGSKGIAVATMLTQKLRIQQCSEKQQYKSEKNKTSHWAKARGLTNFLTSWLFVHHGNI